MSSVTPKNKTGKIKIAAYDPGRVHDGFGMLAADVDINHIYLRNAKVWYNTDADVVARQISTISKEANFQHHLCESNNTGLTIIDLMKRYHGIHCLPITNVRELKDPEKLKRVETMPKNTTVEFTEWLRQTGILLMPAKHTWNDGIKLLNRQLENYIKIPSNTGVSYRAADDAVHDDLVSCLLILCHYARRIILRIGHQDTTAFGVQKSKAYAQIENMHKKDSDIKADEYIKNIKTRTMGRIPSNFNMKIDGVLVK